MLVQALYRSLNIHPNNFFVSIHSRSMLWERVSLIMFDVVEEKKLIIFDAVLM